MDPKTPARSFSVDQNCMIDLHLHLDGSLSPATARALAAMQGISLPEDPAALERMLRCPAHCRDLNDYLACFDLPLSLLQTGPALREATRRLLAELAEKGFCYAELRFAPQSHGRAGMTQEQAVRAALEGLEGAPLPARVILCAMRGADNAAANEETLRLAGNYLGRGVAALDLAGAEALFPTRDFAPLFARARAMGVPFVIHAGEADGPASVAAALEMGPRRIGHGVRALEDPAVTARLARERVPLTVCPTSNLDTRVFERLEDFPLRAMLAAGLVVTVNSDNMAVSGTDVRQELQRLADCFDLGAGDIRRLLLNAVEASFAEEEPKQRLRAEIGRRLPQEERTGAPC